MSEKIPEKVEDQEEVSLSQEGFDSGLGLFVNSRLENLSKEYGIPPQDLFDLRHYRPDESYPVEGAPWVIHVDGSEIKVENLGSMNGYRVSLDGVPMNSDNGYKWREKIIALRKQVIKDIDAAKDTEEKEKFRDINIHSPETDK